MKTLKKKDFLTTLLAVALLSGLGACASMRDFIYQQAGDDSASEREPASVAPAQPEMNYTSEIGKANYYQAYARWPWADGSQLRRRAMILSLDPSPEVLSRLDNSRDAETEIRVLVDLARNKRIGMNSR